VATLVEHLPARDQLPVLLCAYTGLPAGELLALRRSSVDLLHGQLHVTHAIKEVGTEAAQALPDYAKLTPSLVIGPTKTHQARKVALPEFLTQPLKDHLAHQPSPPDTFLFTTPAGQPVRHNQWAKRVFAPAARAARPTNPPRFHDLRHAHASLLIQAGASIVMVSKRLGHASTRMTLDTYSHLYPSEEAALAAALDEGRRAQAQQAPAPAPAPADLEARRTRRAN
jgi:integrase